MLELPTCVLCFQMKIVQATGLPQHLSNFVFCQYHFWDQPEAVFIAPEVNLTIKEPQSTFIFNNCKVRHFDLFYSLVCVRVNMRLCISRSWKWQWQKISWSFWQTALWLLRCTDTSRQTRAGIWLSGMWGWFSRRVARSERGEPSSVHLLVHIIPKSIIFHICCVLCRWSEVTRRLELWVQILELNDVGEFVPVEVQPARDVHTGGIFQLKQVCVRVVFMCKNCVNDVNNVSWKM